VSRYFISISDGTVSLTSLPTQGEGVAEDDCVRIAHLLSEVHALRRYLFLLNVRTPRGRAVRVLASVSWLIVISIRLVCGVVVDRLRWPRRRRGRVSLGRVSCLSSAERSARRDVSVYTTCRALAVTPRREPYLGLAHCALWTAGQLAVFSVPTCALLC